MPKRNARLIAVSFGRATDADGKRQPLEPPWNWQGMGNNLVQTVPVTVHQP